MRSKQEKHGLICWCVFSAAMFIACGGAISDIPEEPWNTVVAVVLALFGFGFMALAIAGPPDDLRQRWIEEEKAKLQKRLRELS